MQAASPSSFDPAGAGGVLLGALLVCIGLGVLIGWLAGSTGIGVLIGAVAGISSASSPSIAAMGGCLMPSGGSRPRGPSRHVLPALGSGLFILFALPVFLLFDWRFAGWALAAVLWSPCTRSTSCCIGPPRTR